MIRSWVFIIAAGFALPALAQGTASDGSGAGKKDEDPNRKICERVEKIGSRLASSKVCMTAAEWKAHRESHRHDFEAERHRATNAGSAQ